MTPTDIARRLLEDEEEPKDFAMRQPVYWVLVCNDENGREVYWNGAGHWVPNSRMAFRYKDLTTAKLRLEDFRETMYYQKNARVKSVLGDITKE